MANTSAPADQSKWTIIYPVYLDKRKTVAQGRRVPKEKAVEGPTLQEIIDVCKKALSLEIISEPDKAYSRDTTLRGRVKIHLKKDDKTPINAEIHNKNQLLLKLAEWIPKHPSRSGGGAASAAQSGGKKKKGKGGK